MSFLVFLTVNQTVCPFRVDNHSKNRSDMFVFRLFIFILCYEVGCRLWRRVRACVRGEIRSTDNRFKEAMLIKKKKNPVNPTWNTYGVLDLPPVYDTIQWSRDG